MRHLGFGESFCSPCIVQFDPQCFHYVLEFFKKSGEYFYGTPDQPNGLFQLQQQYIDSLNDPILAQQNPLLSKQAIIVLREELEYFAIPPKGSTAGTDKDGTPNDDLNDLKRECGQRLLEKKNIFTALQRNVNKENNMAEQHLIDMLCVRYVPNLSLFSFPFISILSQWLRQRGYLGFPSCRAQSLLHFLYCTSPPQDWYHS